MQPDDAMDDAMEDAMHDPGEDRPAKELGSLPPSSLPQKVWTSEQLFGESVEVFISHGDQLYRLRRTRSGKLILCK
jgi:hemin uptake protein HemP